AARAVLDPGRVGEHRAVRAADVLRPAAVPVLRAGAASGRPLGPGRPGRRGRSDVGARVGSVSAAAVRDRRAAAVGPRSSGQWAGGSGQWSEGGGPNAGARSTSPGRAVFSDL